MRLLVTGGTGVLGRALLPAAEAEGHTVVAPGRTELDLFDREAVAAAAAGADAILHLATRIPGLAEMADPAAWAENDRLRSVASRMLVDAALAGETAVYVQPTITFVYPEGPVSEETPIGTVRPIFRSALDAEGEARRFGEAGRRGVVLRFGLLDGPGTRNDEPLPVFGATLDVRDAARALLLALGVPSGIYNVCRDAERVSNTRFSATAGWRPEY